MIKTYPSQINNHREIDVFLELFNYWKHKKNNTKEKKKLFKDSSEDKNATNSSQEIILSNSGQTKIDNLNSCLDLNDCDFIVF
jgi:hypothetical protein